MLRTVLLGLFIPLSVGVLAAMELRTPPRSAAAVVQPLAEPAIVVSDSHDALAKADRLEIAVGNSETPAQPTPAEERSSRPEGVTTDRSELPRSIDRLRLDPKPKKAATATRPRSTMKAMTKSTEIKRSTIPQRSKTANSTEPCRLNAFGGLRKALNTDDCQI